MNEQSSPLNKSRFAPLSVAKEAYRIVFANPRDMVRMLWLATLVLAVSSLKFSLLERDALVELGDGASSEEMTTALLSVWDDTWVFVHMFINVLVLCAVFVSLHRYVLLGARPPKPLGVSVGAREGRYMGYMLASWFALLIAALGAGLAFSVVSSVLAMLTSGGDQQQMMAVAQMLMPPGLAGMVIVLGVVYSRLGLAMPSVALDAPGGVVHRFRAAWSASRGYTLRLFTLIVLTTVPLIALDLGVGFAFSGNPGELAPLPLEVISILISAVIGMVSYAVTTNAFSLAFLHLHKPEDEAG